MSKIKADFVSVMGNDLTVVNAARVSFDKHKDAFDASDIKLVEYLAKHRHWSPFAHPMITLRENVPIFVARQRFKHMVGFTYNEVSRRYVDSPPEFYVPEVWRSRPEGSVKQGSGSGTKTEDDLVVAWDCDSFSYSEVIKLCENWYNNAIEQGVAPEMARMVLPQSMMTSYYVTGSLYAFANAYRQRADDHSQKEIQDLAKQWDGIIRPLFPESWKALVGG